MIKAVDYKNIAVVKTIEVLSEHLAKHDRLVLDFYDFHNKDYLFFLHVFNNFRSSIFTHHDHIYVEMSKWNYFWNRKKCKHFNIKNIPIEDSENRLNEIVKVYKMLNQVVDKMKEEYPNIELDNIVSDAYDDFYAEGDKKFVRNLY